MDETNLDDLRKELASLEAAEAKISAERRRLHDRIDYGFADAATQDREREVSDERRQLHERIDALRALLGDNGQDAAAPEPPLSPLRRWSGISAEAVAAAEASADEADA